MKRVLLIVGVLVLATALGISSAMAAQPPSAATRQSGAARQSDAAVPSQPAAELIGVWSGSATHQGESVALILEFEAAAESTVLVRLSVPVVHLVRTPVAKAAPRVHGDAVTLGPFVFQYDRTAHTLSGSVPEALAPTYHIPFTLRRVGSVAGTPRPDVAAPTATPAWTFDAGSACWPGVTVAAGVVFAGCEDGRLHAVDARTGQARWSYKTAGPIRTRATVSGADLYIQSDDGWLYKLGAADGAERWRVRVVETPIQRLPLDNPNSRFDCFGSDVTVGEGRLLLGTHDGRVVAIDPARGAILWEFRTGDSVLAAPALSRGRVYVGSVDKYVYALDAATGRLVWKHDTQGAVVSTPAVDGGRLIVGNRNYDLLGLDTDSGAVVWTRYIWFSWVESSASLRDGIAYVGSSDAAAAFAFETQTGRPIWKTDVRGWAWGQPAITDNRVYVGTASQPGYFGGAHRGGAMALDRKSGRPVWRVAIEAGKSGPTGFPGSAAVGEGLVFFAGLDGKVYAFVQ